MSVLATAPPNPLANWPFSSLRRLTVAEYHQMIWAGILTEYDDIELLEGYLILKMSRNAPHDGTVQKANRRLLRRLPPGWDVRLQPAITLDDSEPEPEPGHRPRRRGVVPDPPPGGGRGGRGDRGV